MPENSDTLHRDARVALQRTHHRALADEWSLVLMSQGLHPLVRPDDGYWVLSVPLEEAAPSAAALAAYLNENPALLAEPRDHDEPEWIASESDGLQTALLVSSALVAFFMLTGPRDPSAAWFARGSADAAAIGAGELWRCVTALTLHADVLHVMSNAILGALLLSVLCRLLGSGLAVLLVLISGALGNALNAVLQTSHHVSIGASTAVFGALGILAALAVMRRRRFGVRGRRAWIPVAAGLGILAMLGTGGERVDLWAHLLGFVSGAAVGLLHAALGRPVVTPAAQLHLAALSLASVTGCWLLALR